MTRRIVPDQVLERPEPLPEAETLVRVPSAPFAFMWFLIRKHFLGHVIVLVLLAGSATSVEAFGPYALSRLINAITAAVETKASFGEAILPWLVLLAVIWLGSTLAYRAYEAVDVATSPRMRALAQKYMFTYLMGHSPRYFQENFAGKLGQKIKEAGRAILGILDILCFDASKITVILVVATTLMAVQAPLFAMLLVAWMTIYLAVTTALARRCVLLSKAFSAAVSTSTGRLIDSIANADTVRSFAKADFERLLSHKPEVVLFGTGAAIRFPHPRLTRALTDARIGLEVMDTPAACRTFNILAAEGRSVIAALLVT
jgi:ATP-binding cassette subfamily B protein